MNLFEMGFGLLQLALGVAALIFGIRGLSDSVRALPHSGKGNSPKLLSPSLISCQALLAAGFVARLAYLLLREPRGAFETIQILILFIAADVVLIVLAIHYWKSYRCLQNI